MKKNKTTQRMAMFLLSAFALLFLVLAGRFLFIQASGEVAGVNLKEFAESKRTDSYTLEATRGKILDRNGMELAYDQPTYSIYAIVSEKYSADKDHPIHVTDVDKTSEEIADIIDADPADLKERLQKGIDEGLWQVEFGSAGKGLTQDQKKKIEELDLPGIQFTEEAERFYPNGTFASQIIGLAQRKDGVITGMTGIEQQLNDQLAGKNGNISYERDGYGYKLLNPSEEVQAAQDGDNVYLTIDQKIQTLLEDTLTQVDDKWNPKKISAVVMNPKTGEIVAMSNRPSYDPNDPENVENWYNDAISNPMEPGSTMKMFTVASAIEEGKWNPDEEYKSGSFKVDKETTIYDWKKDGWGSITNLEGIQRSSNVMVANLVANKIGEDKFLNYLKKFHFDQKAGIDLPGEIPGTILYNYQSEKISASYGQGTTATPIQMITAASAIANDGKMVTPHIIDKIVNPDTKKVVEQNETKVQAEPISKETADETLKILESVVTSEHGTGKPYKLDDYSVSGKTGTAQIPNPNGGGYMEGKNNYLFSFLGMAPADDPELIMYVSVLQPELKETETGSEPSAFIFKNVMENALHYMDISPDQADDKNEVSEKRVPDIEGMSSNATKKALEDTGMDVVVVGEGNKVATTSVESGQTVLEGERAIIVTDEPTMPDIKGWSMREVLELGELLQLDVETINSGYAKTQSIKKGTKLNKNDYLAVEFST
ncbi:penicillin-binding protein [Terribacillus saccharophilus]|uniref:serine-type D-Ala-D-Ala carboxypeptidase n=1 Tax=Terribacillus saccharophilus TaxID=361277 RepID=A0ABX4H2M9_9BACI|nr:penicillin-binding protein [Terribacillus saccharophilus]PAD37236.1 penicillin-binding protein [Terribacillus saccharophilus]PAD97332.1 penicillin-binding protein [Terribacillus saccharophilus]PAE01380.1 penicillin-binding protein [Terribacillus saccharophilus]